METASEVRNAILVVALTLAASAVIVNLLAFMRTVLWEPLRLKRVMQRQGVGGPPFRFLVGNLPEAAAHGQTFPEALPTDDDFSDFSPTVTPQYSLYFPKYGKRFLYWWGSETRLVVREPELVKRVLDGMKVGGDFERSHLESFIVTALNGKGVHSLDGKKWAIDRQTLKPFFHQEALKGMIAAMVNAAASEIHKWEQMVAQAGGSLDYGVETDVHAISGKVISYTAFGYDSYETGKQLYGLQTQYLEVLYAACRELTFWFPGYRRLPTKRNKLMTELDARINGLVHKLVDTRRNAVKQEQMSSYGNDLLGRMLAAASDGDDDAALEFNLASVYNNARLVYFAGQESVSQTLNFALMMLARFPEWQDLAREEILSAIGDDEDFNSNKLSRLKVVEMILNEVMRLYPTVPILTRVAKRDTHLEDLFIPKGLSLELAIQAMHRDPKYWGEDVGKFNPGRFANGVSKACTPPQAFVPFSYGPKNCIAINFTMVEMKIIVSMVLRRFQLLPSPNYKHHPQFGMTQTPKYGVHIILKAL
ncbi:hypothetical protein KC19_11G143900 [Ceratodon purpureus]|uniref:Cytochrome P450 n=1 Tax=Ceratodon purpureus TaxID=3225 RepID=A0A8T0GF23_CERPU|nr:hypothetical protein KC19_11G143900 [Ceratodon purpureus]